MLSRHLAASLATRLAVLLGLAPLVVASLLPAASAAAEPRTGRYQARPAPVVGCGGLFGECRIFQLEGWVEVETSGLPFPGSPPLVRFLDSDLRLRPIGGDAPIPFPAPGDLQLAQLVVEDGAQNVVELVEPPGSAQTVRLEILGVVEADEADEARFLLSGVYDEGCCDRSIYDIGGVLFDWTAPLGQPPALRLDHGFSVGVEWRDGRGGSGVGTPVAFDGASGHFWFFRPDNPELLVKVIDACEPFDRWWFFAAGLTDVEVEITVDGPGLFQQKTYSRPAGEPFAPILDTDAFPCSEPVI